MKVLVVTNLYPSPGDPTRGLFNLQGFRALARHAELRLVVPVRWWTRHRRPLEWLQVPVDGKTGILAAYPTYWALPHLPRTHVPTMHRALRAVTRRIREQFPFDAILAAMAYPEGVAAARLADDRGCALVTMVLGSDVNELARRPGIHEEVQQGLRRCERVVCVSRGLRERVLELGVEPDRVSVQHNGVDGERFRIRDRGEARREVGLPEDGRFVCFVGNLVPEKGPQVLIEALGRLHSGGDERTELLVIGGGVSEGALRARAAELGLGQRVRFLGRREHSEIAAWISASDLLCLPSFREGCPNVVLEALASGRAVVASKVGGVPELLDERTGVLVPPGDAAALAEALSSALRRSWDPHVLRGSVEFLSWDDFGAALFRSLEAAVNERDDGARGGQLASD